MSNLRKAKAIRKFLRVEMQRELRRYWELPFKSRLKLAWPILRGKPHE